MKDDGVYFEFEAPATTDGDKALELVRRRDIAGCSFSFFADYGDRTKVEYRSETVGGKQVDLYAVRQIDAIHDFTLAADPAYKETDVALLRELSGFKKKDADPAPALSSKAEEQYREMKRLASHNHIL